VRMRCAYNRNRENGAHGRPEKPYIAFAANELAAHLHLGDGRYFWVPNCSTSLAPYPWDSRRAVGCASWDDAAPKYSARSIWIHRRIVSYGSPPSLNQQFMGPQIYSMAVFQQICSHPDCIPRDKGASIQSAHWLLGGVFFAHARARSHHAEGYICRSEIGQ
jgi:hypothetical protein